MVEETREQRARECLAKIVEDDEAACNGARSSSPLGKSTAYYIRDGQGATVTAWAAIRAMLAFASPAEPSPGAGGGEARAGWLQMISQFTGKVISFDAAEPYYLASCDSCGWVGSTEQCPHDEEDVICPRCYRSGADCGSVAARLATRTTSLPAGREAIARELAQHLASGVTGTPDDRGMDDCDDFDSKHPAHREVYFEAADAVLRILAIGPSVEGSGEMVPIRTIMPSLESARMALAHLAKTLPEAEPGKLPLIASYASSEASRLAAAILLLSPPSRERRDEMSEQCRHVWITVTKTTYDLPVPYLRCSRCGETKLPTQGPAS